MKLTINNYYNHEGNIKIFGAKNSAVAVIAAALLIDGDVTLYNIPNIKDINIMINVLNELGVTASLYNNTLYIKGKVKSFQINNPNIKSLRGGYYFYSALLSRFNHVVSFLPGGCNLGLRPINFHLDGFEKFGCTSVVFDEHIEIMADILHPAVIDFSYPSVGATINMIILSTKIPGTTIINNPSLEPEVLDLINFLNHAGASIKINCSKIEITGVKKLTSLKYKIIPDRIEAGSYLLLGCLKPFKKITVSNVNPNHLSEVIKVINKIGAKLVIFKNSITVYPPEVIKALDIASLPYPGFPTDLIQILATILSSSKEESKITDNIFSNRYNYLTELKKINILVRFTNNSYYVHSENLESKANLVCQDLRGAFALFCACFLSQGQFELENIDYIFRGYNNFLTILNLLKIDYQIN